MVSSEASMSENCDIEAFPTESLGLTFEDGIYNGTDNEVRDFSALYRLASSQKVAPSLIMRITGLASETITNSSSPSLFSFDLPLPTMHLDQAQLYTKADDCPSFRGKKGRSLLAKNVRKRIRDCSSTWSSTYSYDDDTQTFNSRTNHVIPTTKVALQHWNRRRKQGLIPPWFRLREDAQGEELLEAFNFENSLSTRPHPRLTLREYLKGNNDGKLWSRWLVVPQLSYGWDLHLMEERLNEMIPTECRSIISHLSMEIVNPAPCLIVHLCFSGHIAQLYRSSLSTHAAWKVFLYSAIFLFLLSLIGRMNKYDGAAFLLALLGSLSGALMLASAMLITRESVDDSVGMAWILKRWIYTGLPASYSEESVLLEVKEKQRRDLTSNVALQRREDGWYLFVGAEEENWLDANRHKIEEVIRRSMQ